MVGLTAVFLAAWRLGWLNSAQRAIVIAVPLVAMLVFWEPVTARLAAFNDDAALARLPLMSLAWDVARDHPLLGVGANNFAVSLEPYLTSDFARVWINVVHNKYLLVLAETGVAGLLTFLWMLAEALRRSVRVARSADAFYAPLAIGLAGGIVANMVHMTADIFNSRPHVQILWLLVAVVLVLDHQVQAERSLKAAESATRQPTVA